ncbi:MAG: retropepsin-like domain-containing protein [Prevotella sp.]|nr:retropepsin-like domain-containing protein [Prevotella sp.]
MKRYDTDFLLSRKNFVMTMPIEVERDQIYLPVTINGRQYRFKLDTGASQGVIYDDVELPGLKELGFIKSEDAIGVSRQVTTVELPPITLDSLTISGFKVQRMRRNVVRRGEDGIIGFALFHRGLAARIDTRARQMTLTDRKAYFRRAAGEALKNRLKWHVPYVNISPFEGTTEEVLFDSGSPLLYAINSRSFVQMQASAPSVESQIEGTTFGSHAIGHFGSEHSHQITLLSLDSLKWGGFKLEEVHCNTVQGGSHIGAPLLRYGAMIIDPFRKQLVFQPYDGLTSCIVANRRPDVVIVEKEGKAMIGMVMEQGRAWQAGFRHDYVIEKVDGEPITFDQFNSYRWVKDQEYEFTLRLPIGILTTLRALWPLQFNQK